MKNVKGRAWVFGDNIDTDVISPGQYLKLTNEEIAAHVMEGAEPGFAQKIQSGDIIVAGKNFGCGSSRESAPAAIKHAGIGAVISPFFARIFYRNAINIGLPVLECSDALDIAQGNEIEIDLARGEIADRTTGRTYSFTPFPQQVLNILAAGGLVPLLEQERKSMKQ